MKLTFKHDRPFDGRRHSYSEIIDQDTGERVGYVRSSGVGFGNSGGIWISMFGGKYSDRLNRFEECFGFMKGVESVLGYTQRHLTSTEYPTAKEDAA